MLTDMTVFGNGTIEDPMEIQELVNEIKKEPEEAALYICEEGKNLILKYIDDIYVITKYLTKKENITEIDDCDCT